MNKQDLEVLERVLEETELGGSFSVEIQSGDEESRDTLDYFLESNHALHVQTYNKATLKSFIAEWHIKGRKLNIHYWND